MAQWTLSFTEPVMSNKVCRNHRWTICALSQRIKRKPQWLQDQSYPQSGAGHQRQSGSDARHLRNKNSSYFSSRAPSSKISATCCGASLSAHSGQLSWTLLSVISIRRYCRRQHRQERWLHPSNSGSCAAGWRTRHRGHSRRLDSPEEWAPVRDCWLEESGLEEVLKGTFCGVAAAVVALMFAAEPGAGAEFKAAGRSCCGVCWWRERWGGTPALGALREPRLLWKRLEKEMRPWRLLTVWQLGLGMPLTEEWFDSESLSDPIFPQERQWWVISERCCRRYGWRDKPATWTQGRRGLLMKTWRITF